jgi:hypothetical protein
MLNPTVNLIFAGSYWTTPQGNQSEQTLLGATQALLASPYLSGLTQYGSDGQAHFGQSWIDSAAVPGNPNTAALNAFLESTITARGALPGFGNWRDVPIYVVISDPQSSASEGKVGGYNAQGAYWIPLTPIVQEMHMVWVGTQSQPGGGVSKDNFTMVLSHELAETISDPDHWDGNGITVQAPAALPSWAKGDNQIGDNEPNGGEYGYRLNGDRVQAYWSRQDNAYIVPDGNTQNFYVDPVWQYYAANQSWAFTNTYNLRVHGDQLGVSYADIIQINKTPNNGVQVVMNGEPVQFDRGVIKTVNVDTGGGTNWVQVLGVPRGVTLDINSSGQSRDLVVVGSDSSSLAAIQGAVYVSNSSGQTSLFVDAINDGPRAVTITDHSVAFSGLTTVNYLGGSRWVDGSLRGVTNLEVWDGKGANYVDLESIPSLTSVTLFADYRDFIWGPAVSQVHIHRSLVVVYHPVF